MSYDSNVQVKRAIMHELEDWLIFYGVVSREGQLETVLFDERNDLVLSIFEELEAGRALDPALTETCGHDDEHYNNTIIQE